MKQQNSTPAEIAAAEVAPRLMDLAPELYERSGKQAGRTTFSLTVAALEALDDLSDQFDVSRRNILDQAIAMIRPVPDDDLKRSVGKLSTSTETRRRAMAVSPVRLAALNRRAEDTGLSRDLVLSWAIFVWQAIRVLERKQKMAPHRHALEEVIKGVQEAIYEGRERLKAFLPQDDPVLYRYGNVEVVMDNLVSAIEDELSGGDYVDPDEM